VPQSEGPDERTVRRSLLPVYFLSLAGRGQVWQVWLAGAEAPFDLGLG